MKKLYALAALCGMALSASAATTPPKVVFIGDFYTYLWSNAFASNPNWINKGADGFGIVGDGETSNQTLARFQADVVALHPAVVHIMIGINDAADPSSSGQPYDPAAVVSLTAVLFSQIGGYLVIPRGPGALSLQETTQGV